MPELVAGSGISLALDAGTGELRVFNGQTPQASGAEADGDADDNSAFQALAAEDRGHAIAVPASKYRISAASVYRGLVKIVGDGFGQNPGEVDGTSYPFPSFFNGSVIYSDANKTAMEFQPFTSETDVATVLADIDAHKTQQSAYGSVVRDLALVSAGNGAAHADKRGIWSRTRLTLANVLAYGHGAEGIRIEASADSPDGHAYGNASCTLGLGVETAGNAGTGFYNGGRDANASTFITLNSNSNGGWGIEDASLIGNTYVGPHVAANTSGSIKTGANSPVLILGPYIENDSGKATDLGAQTMVIGGVGSQETYHDADSPAFVLSAGVAHARGICGKNRLNATTVQAGLGRDPSATASGKIAQWFGTSADAVGTSDEHRLKYEFQWTGVWAWNFRNTIDYLELASADTGFYSSLTYPMAVGFPQGLALGTISSGPRMLPAATAAPTTGTYRRGDTVPNSTPSAGGKWGWVCTTAGTPGTWKAFGVIDA